MSDLELLFLVLALLYVWECACWFRCGSVALSTWLGRRWRMVHPGRFLGNQHGGFILAAPLPPLGNLLSGTPFPLALSPETVFVRVSSRVNPGSRPEPSGGLFRLDQIQTVRARGKKVLINGATLLKTPSPALARHLVRVVEGLRKAPPGEREGRIAEIFREHFDVQMIRQRWRSFQDGIRPVRWLTNALFLYLFVLAPVLIGHAGLKRSWLGLLIGLLALTSGTALFFRRAHQALYPEAEDDRFTHSLTILLSPATAIRGQDLLSRGLLETFHPLAIAQVFCPPTAFRSFAGKVLLEIRFPAPSASPACQPEAGAAQRFSQSVLQRTVEAFLIRHGINPEELLSPPAPADETCRAYCPRCREQFTIREGICPDCGGLPLVAFSPSTVPVARNGLQR